MSKLKTKRMEAGLSQSQLAERTNINLRTLQHYEQGSKIFDHARMDTIIRVCLVLNCKIENIIENQNYIGLIKEYMDSQSS